MINKEQNIENTQGNGVLPVVISRYLLEVSKKHNIPIERLMCGVLNNDFYIWDYDSGRRYDMQFKVVGIFPL